MSEKRKPIFLCPSADGWVAWQLAEDVAWTAVETLAPEASPWDHAAAKSPWIGALRSATLQTMALKLPAGDNEPPLDEVIPLRLEAAGMSAGEGKVVLADWAVAQAKSDHRVVTVWSIDPHSLENCTTNRIPQVVVPSFLRWKWQAKELVLWCEAGRWIAAFSGESCPVHVQPCVSIENISQLAADLRGQATALLLRGLAQMPERLVIRGEAPAFAQELATELRLPLVEKPEAPEVLPEASRLLTKEMHSARESATEAKKWRLRIAAAAALWLGLAAYTGHGYFQAREKLVAAQDLHAQVTPRAADMHEVQATLDDILVATGPNALPLEILTLLSKSMPASDFRLTTFTVEGDRDVYLKGTAKRADLALRFGDNLRRNRDLGEYQWETPSPIQEKDQTASFSYIGKIPSKNPK